MEELEHYIAEIEALEFELGQSCKVIKQQQAEIERLKEQCSKSSFKDSWKNKFFKAQEEIERLTEREKFLENAWNTAHECTKVVEKGLKASEARNAELQKQVDELKEERYYTEQDTAKEIYQELNEHGTTYVKKWIKERYGLEVE